MYTMRTEYNSNRASTEAKQFPDFNIKAPAKKGKGQEDALDTSNSKKARSNFKSYITKTLERENLLDRNNRV